MSWKISSVMTTDVVTVGPRATYKEIAGLLRDKSVGALPVIDADRRVLGVVSEADLLLKEERSAGRLSSRLLDRRGEAAKATARYAARLMSAPAHTIGPDATLTEAARLMHRRHVKRLPVVDADGVLVGIVSRGDLLIPFVRSDDSIAAELRTDVIGRTLALDPNEINVGVRDGVVTLSGELETLSLARILGRLAAAVEGVVAVEDRLRWRLDDTHFGPGESPLALRYSAEERK